MPAYNSAPYAGNNNIRQMVPGHLEYAFGTRPPKSGLAAITTIAANGTTATVGVTLRSGNIPRVGDLVTIQGCPNNNFNVTNAALTGVTIDSVSGIGTIQFALAQTVSTTASSGAVYIQPIATPEAVTNNEASRAFAIPQEGPQPKNRTIAMQVHYSTAPSAATITLQGSNVDNDSDYSDLIQTTTLSTDLLEITFQNLRFVRAKVTGLTGTPTVVVTIGI